MSIMFTTIGSAVSISGSAFSVAPALWSTLEFMNVFWITAMSVPAIS